MSISAGLPDSELPYALAAIENDRPITNLLQQYLTIHKTQGDSSQLLSTFVDDLLVFQAATKRTALSFAAVDGENVAVRKQDESHGVYQQQSSELILFSPQICRGESRN